MTMPSAETIKVTIGEETLVFAPPVNEITQKWGVYAIPRMWRHLDGSLVVRFNGEEDTGDTDHMQVVPHLYFVSQDDGATWSFLENGERYFSDTVFNGIQNPYTDLGATKLAFRERPGCKAWKNVAFQKEFLTPCQEAIVRAYRYGDIPEECKGVEGLEYADSETPKVFPVTIDFPEREVLINAKGNTGKEFVDVEEKMRQSMWKNPYFSTPVALKDGTLVAVSCGQNPNVPDHYCGIAYLLVSEDNGRSWKKRSTIAESTRLPYGYTGDHHENSLTLAKDNTLICAMRMDMSINPDWEKPVCGTMVTTSVDNGYTWTEPMLISDESVTPQLVALENGIVACVYGRPGVHFKYSTDSGKTWSNSYSIIGKTLEEYRKDGISDLNSKYADTCSYSNTFVEKLNEDTFLVLYNNLKHDPGDGMRHKSAFVRKVTLKKV